MDEHKRVKVSRLPVPMQEFVNTYGNAQYVDIITPLAKRLKSPYSTSKTKPNTDFKIEILGEEYDYYARPLRLESPPYAPDDVDYYIIPSSYLLLKGDYGAVVMVHAG